MTSWLNALADLRRDNQPAVLITIVSARGSTPREAGCKMVVTADDQFDTIGGGNLEFTCIETARHMLDAAEAPVLRDFPLGPGLGQCCGGHVSVLFEPFRPPGLHVALFGAGHVGRALVALLSGLRSRVTWIDTRADALAAAPPGINPRLTADAAREVVSLPSGTLVLVMTHDHQIDFNIVAAALSRDDFIGVGLIGSATKRARFVGRLSRLGIAADAIGRLICPIGVPGAGAKLPAEIAVSVAAQILQIQEASRNRPVIKMPELPVSITADCGDCASDCARLAVPA